MCVGCTRRAYELSRGADSGVDACDLGVEGLGEVGEASGAAGGVGYGGDLGLQFLDEFATLINPGRDTGPVFIHGISNDAVRNAPTFAEIVSELLARLARMFHRAAVSA